MDLFTRCRISSAAFLLKVTHIISFGETPFDNKWRNLPTRVVVFPVPGPARTKLNFFLKIMRFFDLR